MVKKIAIVTLAIVLAACKDGHDEAKKGGSNTASIQEEKTPEEKITYLEETGAIPKLDRSDSLQGTDSNANGVRDDIDAFIENKYEVGGKRSAALQNARALQQALIVDSGKMDEVKAVNLKISHAVNCIYQQFPSSTPTAAQVTREIESITANTKLRLQAYLKFNKALDGTSSALPKGDTCE